MTRWGWFRPLSVDLDAAPNVFADAWTRPLADAETAPASCCT